MTKKDLSQIKQLLNENNQIFDYKLKASESRVLGEIGKFISDNLLPALDEKADKTDVARLEARFDQLEGKVDRFIDKSQDHENRIKAIEQVPTIAYVLSNSK